MGVPSMSVRPLSHFCRPIMVRSSVVLPAPLGPRIARSERSGTSKDTFVRIGEGAPGYVKVAFSTLIIALLPSGAAAR